MIIRCYTFLLFLTSYNYNLSELLNYTVLTLVCQLKMSSVIGEVTENFPIRSQIRQYTVTLGCNSGALLNSFAVCLIFLEVTLGYIKISNFVLLCVSTANKQL